MKTARTVITMLLVVVMLCTVAGCSTQPPEQPVAAATVEPAAEPAATPAAEPTVEGFDGTVTFGVVAPLTGTNVMLGDFISNAAELAAAQINAGGGILGKELVLVYEDEVDNLQASVNAMTKMMANEDVSAFFGSTYSSYCLAALPILLEHKIPMYTGGTSANLPLENNPYLWQPCMSDDMTGLIMAKAVQDTFKSTNPAIMYVTDSFGTGLKDNLVAEFEKIGIKVAEGNIYGTANDEKNFSPILTQIVASDVDSLVAINHETPAALICQQVQASGLDIPLMGSASFTTQSCRSLAGDSADGWYSVTEFVPDLQTPVGKSFIDAYNAEYGMDPDTASAIIYDSILLFKKACEIAGTTTDREAINGAMRQIKDFDGTMTTYSYYGNCCLASSKYLTHNEGGKVKMVDTIIVR